MRESVSSLAVKVLSHKKNGKKTVLITGCGAENGTTMVAINLSVALSSAGCRTLLIDADMRSRVKYGSRMADIGLCDYLSGVSEYDEIVNASNMDGLYVIPSGIYGKDPALLLCSRKTEELIKKTRDFFDVVVIDCPPAAVVSDASVLFPFADGIVLVCALDKTTKRQLITAKTIVAPYRDKYYGLVCNGVDLKTYKHLFPQNNYYRAKSSARRGIAKRRETAEEAQ